MRITWQSHSRFAGHVTRYMVKWQHLGNPSQPKVDGHKIINAGKPYHRETQVGGLKPFSLYAFVVREEVGQENWGAFSEPVDVILPEDGMLRLLHVVSKVNIIYFNYFEGMEYVVLLGSNGYILYWVLNYFSSLVYFYLIIRIVVDILPSREEAR